MVYESLSQTKRKNYYARGQGAGGGGLIRVGGGLSLGGGTLIRDSRVVRKANIFKMRQLTC